MTLQSRRFTTNQTEQVVDRLEQALANQPPMRLGERCRGAVRAVQHALADLDNEEFDPGKADGLFGRRTAQAVRNFQRAFGFVPDGIVGAQTLGELDRLYTDQVVGTPRGIALHFGLNAVDPVHYGGWDGVLAGCENDAHDMHAIAEAQGYAAKTFLTADARSSVLFSELEHAARTLSGGDILLLSYSGHGGQVPNTNGDDESDGLDETWCMFDREVIDDELHAAFARFQKGVRIFVISDSCHSGTVARAAEFRSFATAASSPMATLLAPSTFRAMPSSIASDVYEKNRIMYDGLQNALPAADRQVVAASVLLLSGCQDHQLSGDMMTNGVFTAHLKATWASGSFRGTYRTLHEAIRARMPSSQQPNLFCTGQGTDAMLSQQPFAI